jgi:hypothetical protein
LAIVKTKSSIVMPFTLTILILVISSEENLKDVSQFTYNVSRVGP